MGTIMIDNKRLSLKWIVVHVFAVLIFFMGPTYLFAHGGVIDVNEQAHGPVELSDAQTKAIDLKTAEVSIQPLASLLPVNGVMQLLPNAQADIAVRISGQVTALYANVGDVVKAGQPLVKVQSRLVGDPPPSVTINASIDGIIDARNVNPGQSVEPNTVLFHISNRAEMLAIANVYEEDLGKIKLGQQATIHPLSYPDQTFKGQVELIEPTIDPISRTTKVWIKVNNDQQLLKPDMFVSVNIILNMNGSALVIPNNAILEANGEKFVFVRTDSKYERVEITTGATDETHTEITQGLSAGNEVVTQGNREIYTMWLTGGKMAAKE